MKGSSLRHLPVLLGIAFALFAPALLSQSHWPQFRGPDARGIGHSNDLPIQWSTNENVSWQVEVPGRGWSSPVIWGDRLFLTTVVSEGPEELPKKGLYFGGERKASEHPHRWIMLCLDRHSGKTLWTKELFTAVPTSSIHVKNSHASETPVADANHVYALFGQIGLFCLTHDGDLIWSKSFDARETRYGWGSSISPVIHDNQLFVVRDFETESELTAFDTKSGKELWRVPRDEPTNFATPYIWAHPDRTELVVPGRNKVRSYSLDGKVLWSLKGMSTITIPTPFEADGLLYLCAGYVGDRETPNKPVYAVRPGGSGDLAPVDGTEGESFIAWMEPNAAPYNPSALVYKERFYVLWDFGFLNCRNARTGVEVYDKQRLNPTGTAAFTSSPWAYRDRIFCLSEDGDTYVIKAGDAYEVERINSLGEMCMATPAMADGGLYIRTLTKLWCLKEAPTQ